MVSLLVLALPVVVAGFIHFYDVLTKGPMISQQDVTGPFDFIVVGAGSAGAVVASRLSEDPTVRVLLLEAGGEPPFVSEIPALALNLQQTNIDWKYKTVPQKNACFGLKGNQSAWPRGKVLGGSSILNFLMYIRGNRHDFDNWEALGNEGWSYDKVLPYFLKSEDNKSPWMAADEKYHNTGGYLTVSDIPFYSPLVPKFLQAVHHKLGYSIIDTNGPFQKGAMPIQATMRQGARCSTEKAFIRPARQRQNLQIVTHAYAKKIIFNNQKKAVGILFDRFGQEFSAKATKEIVISAGTINTPQLLLLSGIGPSDELESHKIPIVEELKGVGQNLHDRIIYPGLIWTLDVPVGANADRALALPVLLEWILYGHGGLTSTSLEATLYINNNQSKIVDWPEINVLFFSSCLVPLDGGAKYRHIVNINDEIWEKYYVPLIDKDTFAIMPTVLRPKSRGSIKLQSDNPYDKPLIDPAYLTHEDDVRILVEGIKMALKIGSGLQMSQFGAKLYNATLPGCERHQMGSDSYFECICHHLAVTLYHPVGTAKMGPSTDEMAVVDSKLRIYNVTSLRVCDASIMPQITSGNTNAPTIMIGEKCADMIKSDYHLK